MSNNSNKNETTTSTTTKVIISIDIGSSSIRCSAYSVQKGKKIKKNVVYVDASFYSCKNDL